MNSAWRAERFSIGGRDVAVRLFPLDLVDADFLEQWRKLETSAVEGNVFLSPHFLQAARIDLTRQRILLLAIARRDGVESTLIGLGAFIARPPNGRFLLPHLEAFNVAPAFLDGMLFDRDHQWLALEALGIYLGSPLVHWCGLRFRRRLVGGVLDQMYKGNTITSPVKWDADLPGVQSLAYAERATRPGVAWIDAQCHEVFTRLREALGDAARLDTRVYSGDTVGDDQINRFFEYGVARPSPGSDSTPVWMQKRGFLAGMLRGFWSEGRGVFVEIVQDGQVMVSTCALIGGRTLTLLGSATLPGVDSRFATLAEFELLRWFRDWRSDVVELFADASDASAAGRACWQKRELIAGVAIGGNVGAIMVPAMAMARGVRRTVLGR